MFARSHPDPLTETRLGLPAARTNVVSWFGGAGAEGAEWAIKSASRASSSRILRCALLSRLCSVMNVGAVGDTGPP
jgi:hypothetical protein